jgi:hypothetical protein
MPMAADSSRAILFWNIAELFADQTPMREVHVDLRYRTEINTINRLTSWDLGQLDQLSMKGRAMISATLRNCT